MQEPFSTQLFQVAWPHKTLAFSALLHHAIALCHQEQGSASFLTGAPPSPASPSHQLTCNPRLLMNTQLHELSCRFFSLCHMADSRDKNISQFQRHCIRKNLRGTNDENRGWLEHTVMFYLRVCIADRKTTNHRRQIHSRKVFLWCSSSRINSISQQQSISALAPLHLTPLLLFSIPSTVMSFKSPIRHGRKGSRSQQGFLQNNSSVRWVPAVFAPVMWQKSLELAQYVLQ